MATCNSRNIFFNLSIQTNIHVKIITMSNYPYRKGVNAIVLDSNKYFLLVQKQTYDTNQWDFPGGGLEDNEDPKTGILRELEEELGSKDFKIIHESHSINTFEWPKEAQEHGFKKHGKWYRGQQKHQFIVKFTGDRKNISLQEEEIRKIAWVPYLELKNYLIFEKQWENIKRVLDNFGIVS